MECFYINLAAEAGRRAALEKNFHASNPAGWPLARIEAADAEFVRANAIPGSLREAEKACWFSHIKALEASSQADGHALILEDDVLLGKESLATIEAALARAADDSWDIIYAEVCIANLHSMIEMLALRRRLAGGFTLVDLHNIAYGGTTAYIVNRKFRQRLADMMRRQAVLDAPYDLFLRGKVHEKSIRAFAIFPCPVTVAPDGDVSSIQAPGFDIADAVLMAYRRLTWMERDADSVAADMARLGFGMDHAETSAMARITAAFLSPDFKTK